jgi:mRNA interferase HigB
MHIISKRTLVEFWEKNPATKSALEAWHADAKRAKWRSSADIKNTYVKASIINNTRVVFNIVGNDYRLVVSIRYATEDRSGTIFIKFVGTHKEYDRINAATI